MDIPINKIIPNRYNARRIKCDITGLKNSIERHGLLQKITVRNISDVDGYTHEVVFGDDRFRCTKELGWKVLDCEVRELTDKESFVLSNEENDKRSDISPLEKAISYGIAVGIDTNLVKSALQRINVDIGYQPLKKPFTMEAWGKEIGITRAAVDNIIEPLRWSNELFDLYDEGLSKRMCQEIRIHTKDEFEHKCIGKKLIEIINSGNHIDKKDLKKFLKTIDNCGMDEFEKLLHVVFDKNQRKICVTDRKFLKLCNAVCEAFNIHPEAIYEIDESISDAVTEEHEPDNEEVIVEEKEKSKVPSNETSDDEETWGPGNDVPSNAVVEDDKSCKESHKDFNRGDKSHPLVKWVNSDDGDMVTSFLDAFSRVKTLGEKCTVIQFNKYVENNYKSPMDFIYEFSKSKGIDIEKKTKEYMKSKGILLFFDNDPI